MSDEKPNIRLWLTGLALFAVVVAMGAGITQGDVTWGIIEHQKAGSAARVDTIQAQWRAGGVRNLAIASMIGDLIFIGFYGWGSWIAGRSFMRTGGTTLRVLGGAIATAALVFLVTDYLETTLQVIQLIQDQGVEWMAQTAATVRPIKVAAWIVTFHGVIAALVVRRMVQPAR